MEYLGEFIIERDEEGNPFISCDDEKTAEILESAFIDWCHRGYVEAKAIKYGRVTWKLTPWGEEHIHDIIKVRGEDEWYERLSLAR